MPSHTDARMALTIRFNFIPKMAVVIKAKLSTLCIITLRQTRFYFIITALAS